MVDQLRTLIGRSIVRYLSLARSLMVAGWLWLAAKADELEEKRRCLQAVQELNREKQAARGREQAQLITREPQGDCFAAEALFFASGTHRVLTACLDCAMKSLSGAGEAALGGLNWLPRNQGGAVELRP